MKTKDITTIAIIAAIYTVVSLVLAPFSFDAVQIRISECLTILPLIYKPSIYALGIGCFLTNILGVLTGTNPLGFVDAIVGTTATVLAAYVTYKYRDKKIKGFPLISVLSPVVFNFIFIGIELAYLYMPDNFIVGTITMGTSVAIGELVSAIIGYFVVKGLEVRNIFKENQ